ncbi:MAG: aminopeptidase P family protein [Sphaerochaetaceae bacterium]
MGDSFHMVEQIRSYMKEDHIDAWIIYGSDPHASEYPPKRYLTREYVSQFSGSAGTIVITHEEALLWTDSRYFIQAAKELKETPFKLMKQGETSVEDFPTYVARVLPPHSRVGFEGSCTTELSYNTLKSVLYAKNIEVVATKDYFDYIWKDRPSLPISETVELADEVAGLSSKKKIEQVRQLLLTKGATSTIISSLDDIAWLLNLRGSDVSYNRVFVAYLIVTTKSVLLFTDEKRFSAEIRNRLTHFVELYPYEEFFTTITTLFSPSDVLYYSAERTSVRTLSSLSPKLKLIEGRDISTDLKAVKNNTELKGMREAHIADGIAMVRLLAHLETTDYLYTELSLEKKLEEFRQKGEHYIGPSFRTIAGFGEHGALAHYSSTDESDVPLQGDTLLVLDSGGHYQTGTTDITRTLLFGKPTKQMKEDYTLVLKGHIALATQKFPSGTTGYQLDALARQFMWNNHIQYGHGTGHGIGFCLNVHEGPQSISPRALSVPLQKGMIVSDEPGIYREGEYGIRLENLIVVQHDSDTNFGEFLSFEVITLCPFERRLIDLSLLQEEEIAVVDAYHQWVYSTLESHLDEQERLFLEQATRKLKLP